MPVDPLTIVSAIVALLVLWKLKSVLGTRTGLEKPPINPFAEVKPPPAPKDGSPAFRLPGAAPAPAAAFDPARWRPHAEPGTPLAARLDSLAARDPGFDARQFLEGAKIAYERILASFAAGDRSALQALLAKDVFDGFAAAIDQRTQRGETLTTTFVSFDEVKIEDAHLEGNLAFVDVRFLTKQISATHDAQGQLTDGSPDRVVLVDDLWTFSRDVTSRDPNWKLVATRSGQ